MKKLKDIFNNRKWQVMSNELRERMTVSGEPVNNDSLGRSRLRKGWLKACAASVLAIGAMSSCSDDLGYKVNTGTEGNGLTLYIPNLEGASNFGRTRADGAGPTRATADALESEAGINNIYLIAVDSEGKVKSFDLDEKKVTYKSTDKYTAFDNIDIAPGTYSFYVLANLDDYIDGGVAGLKSKGDLEDATLNFADFTNSILEAGNLPMACLPTEMKYGDTNNPATVSGSGKITVGEGTDATNVLIADLTFLCSKVRYTFLYNKDDEDNQFITNDLNFNSVDVSNISEKTPLSSTSTEDPTGKKEGITVPKFTYDESLADEYLNITTTKDAPDNFSSSVTNWNDTKQRVWQQTLYIPENDPSSPVNKTTLTFDVEGTDVLSEYKLPLVTSGGLERGKFYDIVAQVKKADLQDIDLKLDVKDWSLENISYALHGPYELIVETTTIPVKSNEPGMLWYISDVVPEDISFGFPRISFEENGQNKTVNFYTASVYKVNGHYVLDDKGRYQIQVKINSAIPSTVAEKIVHDVDDDGDITIPQNLRVEGKLYLSDFMYFEIIAGNIRKKIKVSPLDIKPFFRVTPQTIIIDMREVISSGFDSNIYDILIETNISNDITYSIEYQYPDDYIKNIVNQHTGALSLEKSTDIDGDLGNDSFTITEGSGHLALYADRFFKGDKFWQQERTIIITFQTEDGTASDKLTIIVKPSTTDYTIYFKDLKGDWVNPHIYVYQCLEMPADLEMPTGYTGSNYAGKTVGYGEPDKGNAGLEYIFSNNIAFRGWKEYGGTVDPYGTNDDQTTYSGIGFVKWGGSNHEEDFNPTKTDRENRKNIYNYDVDLNSQHDVTKTDCSICKDYTKNSDFNSDASRTWPGVAMIKEIINGEPWYKYTLSGVATPGKAMIMFTNCHNDSENTYGGRRYPNDGQVGVPLFDYPDHVGWFVYDNFKERHDLNFFDDKPDLAKEFPKLKFRIYWNINNINSKGFHLWGEWGTDFEKVDDSDPDFTKWDDNTVFKKVGNYRYVEFYRYTTAGTFNFKFKNDDCGKEHLNNSIDNFKLESDKCYVAHIESDSNHPNLSKGYPTGIKGSEEPTPETDPTTIRYKIYWPTGQGTQIHTWGDWSDIKLANGYSGNFNDWNNPFTGSKSDIDGFNALEFTRESTSGNLNFKFKSPECNANHEGNTISDFELIDGIYYAYIASDSGTSAGNHPKLSPGIPAFRSGQKVRFEWWAGEYVNGVQYWVYLYTDLDSWTRHEGSTNGAGSNNRTYTVTIPSNKNRISSFTWNYSTGSDTSSTVTVTWSKAINNYNSNTQTYSVYYWDY